MVNTIGQLFDLYAGGDVDKDNFSPVKDYKHPYPVYSNALQNGGVYGFTAIPKYNGNSITITGRGSVGVPMYREQPFDAIVRLLVLTPRDEKNVCARFVSSYISECVEFPQESTGVPQLTVPQICNIELTLPPLPEQQAIATALSDTDELITALERLISKKKAIKQGTMQELLTGKRRLAGFSGEWVEKSLGELLQYEQPQKYIIESKEYIDSGIPVLTAGKSLILGYTGERHGIYKNLPVIIFDDFTTESKLIDFQFKVKSSAMKMLTTTNICNIWLVYALMQMINFPLKDHKRYWISEYSKILVKIPSAKSEQTAIASILSDMDEEIETLTAKLNKYKQIKQGMMSELLTGRIRLEGYENG